jgi:acetylserotonin N-methyltransferase
MHAMTRPAASALSEQPVFKKVCKLLDVAGGSGSLTLAIANRHPEIRCKILDLEPICPIAKKHIRDYGLSDQISVSPFDMFNDPWPGDFDGILFGNVFHDWDLESCHLLARRAFDALALGGTICLHEMLLNERKDGPLTVALYSVAMLLHEKGKQFTPSELKEILTDAGFRDFQATPTFGYYSLVTATKK